MYKTIYIFPILFSNYFLLANEDVLIFEDDNQGVIYLNAEDNLQTDTVNLTVDENNADINVDESSTLKVDANSSQTPYKTTAINKTAVNKDVKVIPSYESKTTNFNKESNLSVSDIGSLSQRVNFSEDTSSNFNIKNSHSTKLYELGSVSTSVQSVNLGGYGQDSYIKVRGLGQSHNKILLDDVDMNDYSLIEPYTNTAFISFPNMATANLSIGNFAAKYGSGAAASVTSISILDAMRSEELGTYGNLKAAIASNETTMVASYFGHNTTDKGVLFWLQGENSAGESAAAKWLGNDEKDGFSGYGYGMASWWSIFNDITLQGFWQKASKDGEYDGFDYVSYNLADKDNYYDSTTETAKLELEGKEAFGWNINWQLALSFNELQRNYQEEDNVSSTYSSEFWQLSYGMQFTYGLEHRFDINIKAQDIEIVQDYNSEFFSSTLNKREQVYLTNASWYYDISNYSHDLSALLQYDDNKLSWASSYNMGYKLSENYSIYYELAKGFRTPSMYERYDALYGNNNLEAEEIYSTRLSLQYENANHAQLSLTGFYNLIDNKITFDYALGYQNMNRYQSYGLEAIANIPLTNRLLFTAGYTYTDASYLDNDLPVYLVAKHKASLSMTYNAEDFMLGADVNYLSEQLDFGDYVIDGYISTDIYASFNLGNDLRLTTKVDNVFDNEYETRKGYAGSGRYAQISLEIDL